MMVNERQLRCVDRLIRTLLADLTCDCSAALAPLGSSVVFEKGWTCTRGTFLGDFEGVRASEDSDSEDVVEGDGEEEGDLFRF